MTHFRKSCVYRVKLIRKKGMKACRGFAGWILLIGIVSVSCSKMDVTYDDTVWFGEYPVQTLNGTTGELEDQTAVIGLHFGEESTVCAVTHGLVGLFGTNVVKYDVRWSARDSFSLSKSAGGQTIMYYSGIISGENMKLDALNCDGIAGSYVLKKTH